MEFFKLVICVVYIAFFVLLSMWIGLMTIRYDSGKLNGDEIETYIKRLKQMIPYILPIGFISVSLFFLLLFTTSRDTAWIVTAPLISTVFAWFTWFWIRYKVIEIEDTIEEIKKRRNKWHRLEQRANELEEELQYDAAIEIWKKFGETKQIRRLNILKAEYFEELCEYDAAISTWLYLGNIKDADRVRIQQQVAKAKQRERALDYDAAIKIWEELEEIEEAARVRKLRSEEGSVKVSQKVVHGDEVTEVKDSVINRSNIGAGEDDKVAKLEKIANMKEKGLIDDDEFKQMKKEILGK